ncbi:hypothetical protein GBQ70_10795 [Halomicrobium sp. ZPS1]|uniref:Uncharacterized protein n=1 Tax=Halomicrobium mukohataei TaxID=57705 RepID=A0A4D6KQN4_9EURY|nr:hypothetical protein E5139_10800 [Halomicrobium mukohataei]QFR21925.1 hypothetical protein GBQ70_10795 [Halomicrobium sp. ZPS1]
MVGLAPTVGLTTAGADRGVSVGTAPDGSALIALEPSGTTVTNPSATTVATLRNNAGEPLETTYSVSVDGDGGALTVVTTGTTTNLDSGSGTDIAVKCEPNGQSGTAQLQVHVTEAAGDGVTIRNALLTVDVAYDCPGGGGQPGDRPAFDDADGDGEYDEGEQTYSIGDLEDFENRSVKLVIRNAGTLDATGQPISVKANTIRIQNTTLESNRPITLDADGSVDLSYATIESNKQIQVDAGGPLSANYAQFRSKNEGVALSAKSSIELQYATIDAKGAATATLNTASASLLVSGLSVQDDDNTLVYSPSDVSVPYKPSQGSVEAA